MPRHSTSDRRIVATLALAAASLVSAPSRLQAQPQEADRALERLEQALSKESGLSKETRDALLEVVRSLRVRRGEPSAPGPETALGPAVEAALRRISALEQEETKAPSPLSFYGDVRLRGETNYNLDDQPDRTRFRVRLRAGADYAVTDELKAGARLTTGPRADARSPHQTLGDTFNKFEVNLDRAFVAWRPADVKGLSLTGGKFAHAFYTNPTYAELVWDADVQPEGIAATYAREGVGPFEKVLIAAGEYLLLEQGADSEAFATVAQALATAKLGENWKGTLAAGIYWYSDLTPDNSQSVISHNAGNATIGAAPDLDFASRFTIVNPIAALTYAGLPMPLTMSGEWIKNTHAGIPGDTGYALGAAYGATQKASEWRLYYQWQVVEQDAVLTAVSQDDTLLGSNYSGHIFGVNHQFLDKVGVHLWALFTSRDDTQPGATTDSDKLQQRVRLDLNMRF